ncbi:MAG: hypothetical protein HZB61_03255 [Nitrospirae bacterium]|nr:hypothetical protein [Nitrospirota bacterium]
MKTLRKMWMFILMLGVIVVPSLAFSAPTISVDMDPLTDGIQTDIMVNPGQAFTASILLTLHDNTESLSSLSYSLFFDIAELNTPAASNISVSPITVAWGALDPLSISEPYLLNFSQFNMLGSSQGSVTATIATINWTAKNPVTDGNMDIMPGFLNGNDSAFDKDFNSASFNFEGGKVNLAQQTPVAPEPISTILFLAGGATLGVRRFLKKK